MSLPAIKEPNTISAVYITNDKFLQNSGHMALPLQLLLIVPRHDGSLPPFAQLSLPLDCNHLYLCLPVDELGIKYGSVFFLTYIVIGANTQCINSQRITRKKLTRHTEIVCSPIRGQNVKSESIKDVHFVLFL